MGANCGALEMRMNGSGGDWKWQSLGGSDLKNLRKFTLLKFLVDITPIQQTISMLEHLSIALKDSKRAPFCQTKLMVN